ncbi:MAG: hypothetical protein KDL87_09780, partial [Verrucomicrobiae bacterium]|nr:hypothetical protein [Verrucomicrobiae bacterium]
MPERSRFLAAIGFPKSESGAPASASLSEAKEEGMTAEATGSSRTSERVESMVAAEGGANSAPVPTEGFQLGGGWSWLAGNAGSEDSATPTGRETSPVTSEARGVKPFTPLDDFDFPAEAAKDAPVEDETDSEVEDLSETDEGVALLADMGPDFLATALEEPAESTEEEANVEVTSESS